MGIEDHEFYDEDVGLKTHCDEYIELDCNLEPIVDMGYIQFNREDIIAMAKCMEITSDELGL